MSDLPTTCPECGSPVVGTRRPIYDDDCAWYVHREIRKVPGAIHTVCDLGHVIDPERGTGTSAPVTFSRGEKPVVHFDQIPHSW